MSSFSPLHILLRFILPTSARTNQILSLHLLLSSQNFPDKPQICPVTLVNNYIEVTKGMCRVKGISRPDQLWLSTNLKPITVNTIRKWVRDIIYLGDPNATSKGSNAHTIRAQVATHLFAAGLSVIEILASMYWRSSSTFTRYFAMLGIQTSVQAVLAGLLPSV